MKYSQFLINLPLIFGVISLPNRKYPVVRIIFEDHDSFVLLLKYIFLCFKGVDGQFLNGLAKLSLLGSLTTLKLVTVSGVTLLPTTTRYF